MFYGKSHGMTKEEDNLSLPSPLHSFLVPDNSTWLAPVSWLLLSLTVHIFDE